jgi:hypothetical protein
MSMVATAETERRGRFDMRLPVAEREALRLLAENEGRTSTEVVRSLIVAAARRDEEISRRLFGEKSPDEAA